MNKCLDGFSIGYLTKARAHPRVQRAVKYYPLYIHFTPTVDQLNLNPIS